MGSSCRVVEDASLRPYGDFPERSSFPGPAWLVGSFAWLLTAFLCSELLGKHFDAGRLLLVAWVAYVFLSVGVLAFSPRRRSVRQIWSHAAGVALYGLIAVYSGGVSSPHAVVLVCLLFAVAIYGSVKGSTVAGSVLVLFLVSLFVVPWPIAAKKLEIEPAAFHAAIALFIVWAYFVWYLLQGERQKYSHAALIGQLVKSVNTGTTLKADIERILCFLVDYFAAYKVRVTLQDLKTGRCFVWVARYATRQSETKTESWSYVNSDENAMFTPPLDRTCRMLGVNHALPTEGWVRRKWNAGLARMHASGREGSATLYHEESCDLRVIAEHHVPMAGGSVSMVSFLLGSTWLCWLAAYHPRGGGNAKRFAEFLGALVRDVAPVLYNKHLVARLRSRAQARERARLAQELHDGIIQSLIGVEMKMEVLRRAQTASSNPSVLLEELQRLQSLLHEEIANLREEMDRVKPLEVEPVSLLNSMVRIVEKFGREQGIRASFSADASDHRLPPRVCTELVRILQEALTNVRKHSGAHKVQVRFARENGHYKLSVEDDGRGFGFSGRLSYSELEASPYCPLVIKERVRAIGGNLVVETAPGAGARVEICVPSATPNQPAPQVSVNGEASPDN